MVYLATAIVRPTAPDIAPAKTELLCLDLLNCYATPLQKS